MKRVVWQRDEGRCAYEGTRGRCTETGFLEYHHVVPFARGGAATAGNIQLRCRAHNQYEAREAFGAGGDLFVREGATAYDGAAAPCMPQERRSRNSPLREMPRRRAAFSKLRCAGARIPPVSSRSASGDDRSRGQSVARRTSRRVQ